MGVQTVKTLFDLTFEPAREPLQFLLGGWEIKNKIGLELLFAFFALLTVLKPIFWENPTFVLSIVQKVQLMSVLPCPRYRLKNSKCIIYFNSHNNTLQMILR